LVHPEIAANHHVSDFLIIQSGETRDLKVGRLALLCAVLTPIAQTSAQACTVCMGDPNSNEATAINAAIFLLLGFIGGVLGLLSAFGIYLYRRSNAPIPPHVQLAEMIGASSK
jgi:hypothetical protein